MAKRKTSYRKGLDFENEVAKFMVEELIYNDTLVRPLVSGRTADRAYEIDVLAKIDDKGGNAFLNLSIVALILGLIISIISILEIIDLEYCIIGFILFIASIVYILFSDSLSAKYTWVECKNLKTKAKRDHMVKLIANFDDYNMSKSKKWNITNLMFFSVLGYDHDAKEFAKQKKILCYEKDSNNKLVLTNLNF